MASSFSHVNGSRSIKKPTASTRAAEVPPITNDDVTLRPRAYAVSVNRSASAAATPTTATSARLRPETCSDGARAPHHEEHHEVDEKGGSRDDRRPEHRVNAGRRQPQADRVDGHRHTGGQREQQNGRHAASDEDIEERELGAAHAR